MDKKSPEFRVGAFIQDITNLTATLDVLEITYHLKKTKIEIKDEGRYHTEEIGIPEFQLHQFLGRICMMLDELQAKFTPPANEGLVSCCRVHGKEAPTLCVDDRAFCVRCLAAGPWAEFESEWMDPEDA